MTINPSIIFYRTANYIGITTKDVPEIQLRIEKTITTPNETEEELKTRLERKQNFLSLNLYSISPEDWKKWKAKNPEKEALYDMTRKE